MKAQIEDENRIEWRTRDGSAPDHPWLREAHVIRGTRICAISENTLSRSASIRTNDLRVWGYAVLDEDAPNLKDAGYDGFDNPWGRAVFCRRVFYLRSVDYETPGIPDAAVATESIRAGEDAEPAHPHPRP